MSIAPPSDIVLDVAQAADPVRLQEAAAKLARMAAGAGASGEAFGATLTAAASPRSPVPSSFGMASTLWHQTPAASRTASAYQKFEAVLLQNFMQNILPKDENLFGDAASADMMRTLLAEQLSTQLAKSNRLGIARMIESAHPALAKARGIEVSAATSLPQAPLSALAASVTSPAASDPLTQALDAALAGPAATSIY